MADKKCQICNSNTYQFYPLCKEHLSMIKTGKVIKNEQTHKWELKTNITKICTKCSKEYLFNEDELWDYNLCPECEIEFEKVQSIEYDNESQKCLICNNKAPHGKQCKECYHETLDYKANIDKNRKASDIRDWYYSLRDSIYKISHIKHKQSNCNKLIALAILNRDLHNDDSLISRVYKDIDDILSKAKNKKENEQQIEKEFDSNKNNISGQSKCLDGHWVENDLERDIDDMLYSLRKPHVYAKRVNEITTRTVKSDWFIPVLSDSKGIYIEFWGMETDDYLKNKEEKIKLYKEEELPLIEITRKELLADKSLVKDQLDKNIQKLEKELKRRKN